jgi:hypothetical protein
MTPIIQIIIAFKDSMEKTRAILISGLYTSLGTYYILKSLLGAIVNFIIIILIILASLIVIMWICFPFGWPFAAANSIIFLSISIPLAIIVIFLTQVLHVNVDMSIPGLPSKPSCFDGRTMIKMIDGSYKPISSIKLGEKTFNDGYITAVLKLDAKTQTMYKLNDIIVSGNHKVKYNNEWVYISEYPSIIKIEDYDEQIIYCLNTQSKEIKINDHVFLDWDEIYDIDFEKLSRFYGAKMKTSDIHGYFDCGFVGSTMVTLKDGSKKKIKEISIGTILGNDEKVYGIVEINGKDMNQYKYILESKKEIHATGNFKMNGKTLDKIPIFKEDKLYHLLTDTGDFYIQNEKFYDYNSAIELFLE